MATIEVKDANGKKVGTADVSDAVFAIEPNTFAMHQVVRSQLAARRQGTHDTKGRSEVSGGGRKPWRQKGTGRARQGTIRAPQWKGGGVVFGPTPRSYAFKVPNKVVKLAMRSALSAKHAEGVLYVIEGFGFAEPSTKQAAAVLEKLGITGRCTVVVANDDVNAILSLRNLPKVRVITASEANTYDLVDNTALLFTKPALEWLEGVLK
ncbi:50S ribosomal protein L4 [Coriobacteriia bacterium Es71-Z0120]|uniref:50S ribosomal protein L4 n=1 Tax=Parvivirga hydrogeniphila TaxID=2939460 RepID=UPI002260FF9D|nr:50S ribosomal protein L4 [Parvivirga hydrogeniphila]MCL4078536.1 50S ribosomal protein L4 [Parvivirga hydrogeniphila]